MAVVEWIGQASCPFIYQKTEGESLKFSQLNLSALYLQL